MEDLTVLRLFKGHRESEILREHILMKEHILMRKHIPHTHTHLIRLSCAYLRATVSLSVCGSVWVWVSVCGCVSGGGHISDRWPG